MSPAVRYIATAKRPDADAQHQPQIDFAREVAEIGDISICASPVTTTVSPICQAVEAAHLRQKKRYQVGRAVKAGADHESVERAEREIAIGKGAQIDDRLVVGQHAPEEQDEAMLDTITAARIVPSASQSQRGPS